MNFYQNLKSMWYCLANQSTAKLTKNKETQKIFSTRKFSYLQEFFNSLWFVV